MFSDKSNHSHHSQASKGALIGVIVYLLLAGSKLVGSVYFNSSALKADGLNNLSDIFASLAVFIGLWISNRPADHNHQFGHHKFESISSFIVSIIMFLLSAEIISSAIRSLFQQDFPSVNPNAIWIPCLSSLILFGAYAYIRKLAVQTESIGLKATSQDMRNDILVSLSTLFGIIGSSFHIYWLDTIISFIVGLIILYSAFGILSESTNYLTDAFDSNQLDEYSNVILQHPQVRKIRKIRARNSGKTIYVDIIIEIDGNLSVYQSHQITDEIELIMMHHFNIRDVDIHVEPYLD